MQSREQVARARLNLLLACLGGGCVGPDVGRLLDAICPPGVSVLHGFQAPGLLGPLGHLVIAPRGAVVVGSCWDEAAAEPSSAGLRESRSPAVRGALKGANYLRAFLSGTKWAGCPVLAAVCVLSVPGELASAHDCVMASEGFSSPEAPLAAPTPVVIGDLWMGHAGRLPAWLASGDGLGAEEQEALFWFLAGEVPAKRGTPAENDTCRPDAWAGAAARATTRRVPDQPAGPNVVRRADR